MVEEREEGAKTRGPCDDDGSDLSILTFETINVASAAKNQKTLLERKAHIVAFQEHCLNENQLRSSKAAARARNRNLEGGPLDPETGKTNAGVGILTRKGVPYPVPKPTDDYLDALSTGRYCIYSVDPEHFTLVIAIIYGWIGARKGTATVARTDDLLTIAHNQLNKLPDGPKVIAGDLNGRVDAFGTLQNLLQSNEGWTDVGMDERICKGITGHCTCHANA